MGGEGAPPPRVSFIMARLCVVGGKLQGMEAVYLAKKAGLETILIDRRRNPPASALADETHMVNVVKDYSTAKVIFRYSDVVLPALEDAEALSAVERACRKLGVPYMQDNAAFAVTSDKSAFMRFCDRNGMPYPKISPQASFPVIVKPVSGSGSRGVRLARNSAELERVQRDVKEEGGGFLVQEYASGYFLSLELLGLEGIPQPMQVTCLEFDESYGCKRVLAPWPYEDEIIRDTVTLGERLVRGLSLTGLTDLQVVVRGKRVEIIEANARLPSQTPTAVYYSTGVNMVKLLVELFAKKRLPDYRPKGEKVVIYQHVHIMYGKLKVVAEHELSDASGMRIEKGFYGVDEAVTNLSSKGGVATLIVSDVSYRRAKERMEEAVKSIASDYKVPIEDKSPWGVSNFYDEINI